MFNKHVAQIDWNETSLIAHFQGGLKDEILDSIAIAKSQLQRLQEWMAMASQIDEHLWARRQNRQATSSGATSKDQASRFQPTSGSLGPVPMDLDSIGGTMGLTKMAIERLEFQQQRRCWGRSGLGHIRAKCLNNPSKPYLWQQ